MYKIIITLGVVLVSFSNVFGQKFSGDSWEKIKSQGSGTISFVYVETPAFVYKDASGNLAGICVDIMKAFVNYVNNTHNVKINYKFEGDGSSFRQFYEDVKNSKDGVFGLGNVTIREDRKKEVQFTDPFIKNIALIVSGKSVEDAVSFSDASRIFKGFTAYVPPGSLHEVRMKELKDRFVPSLVLEYVGSSQEAIDAMLKNPRSICFQDIAVYWDYEQKGYDIKYHPLESEQTEELGMIMPLNSDWKPLFDEFFRLGKGFKANPLYHRSLTKHLGNEVVKMLKMAQ